MSVFSFAVSSKSKVLIGLAIIFSMLLGTLAWSEEIGEKKEEAPLIKEFVEVVGHIPVANTIQSVSVLKMEEMETFQFENMKSVLNLIPGLLTLSNGSFGQTSSTYIRGSKSAQVLYIVDGIKLRDGGSLNGVDLSVLSPTMIDKVEVVRGPLSSIYGSDAMGGVISLSTQSREGADFSASYGSHDSYMGSLSGLTRLHDFTLGMTVNSQRFSDNTPNDIFKNTGLSAKVDYNKNKLDAGLRFFGNFTDSGIPFNDLGVAAPDRNYKQTYLIFALPFTYHFNEDTKLNVKLSFTRSKYEFKDTTDFWNPYFVSRFNNYETDVTYSTRLFNRLHLDAGVDYADQSIGSENSLGLILDNKKTSYLSAFTNTGLNLGATQISASVRYDKYKNVPAHVSPQVGISYLFANGLKLRWAYSFSFMAPQLQQQVNPWGLPNFDLKPEQGKSIEAGVEYYSEKLVLGATIFNTKYEDMIGWVTVDWNTFAGQFKNIKSVDTYGLELSATLHPISALTIGGSYTYLHTEDKLTGEPLQRKPKHTFSGYAAYVHKRFSLSLKMIAVGQRPDRIYGLSSANMVAAAFNTFDFCLMVPVTGGLTVYGKMTNAFDKAYQQMLGYDAPGRRLELGFKYKLD